MLLFFAIAAGLVAIYLLVQTVRPLVESGVVTAAEWQRVEDESLQLLERRDQLLAELQELEFEAALHKIDARDLEALRTRYALEAVELDKQIDARREVYDGRIDAQVEQTLADAARKRADRDGGGAEGASTDAADASQAAPEARAKPAASLSKGEAAAETGSAAAGAQAAPAKPAASPDEGAESGALGAADEPGAAIVLGPGEVPTGDCAQCGTALAADARFCDGCGAKVMRACAHCGSANRLGAKFCKACGERVDGEGA